MNLATPENSRNIKDIFLNTSFVAEVLLYYRRFVESNSLNLSDVTFLVLLGWAVAVQTRLILL